MVQLAAEVPLYGTLNGTADGIATMDAALIAVSARIGSVSICSESRRGGADNGERQKIFRSKIFGECQFRFLRATIENIPHQFNP